MSLSALASSRPLGNGRCLRRANVAFLAVPLQARNANSFRIRATPLRPEQRRCQSDETESNLSESSRKPPPQPKLTLRQLTGRALTVGIRNLAYLTSRKGFRQVSRDSPVTTALVIVLLVTTITLSAVVLRVFYKTFYNPEISRYPEPLATTLRRAIYYTTIRPDADRALKFYKKAMAETRQLGLDPLSDRVLGIRILVAFWMEKNDRLSDAAEVLESVRRDCLQWVDGMEQRAKDGQIGPDGRLKPDADGQSTPATANVDDKKEPQQQKLVDLEWGPEAEEAREKSETQWLRRERLLKKAVSTSVKLGEIYADPHVLDPDNSHRHLVWSVETTLKEFRRRRLEGAKPGEGEWMTPAEVGGTMESLGRDYERKSHFHLAIPLFFQGLRNCESPCHRAVIMNNLSACFAQHPIYSPTASGGEGIGSSPGAETETQSLKAIFDSAMPNSRADCLDAAVNWARNAYIHARDVQGEDRTPECDEACAVALCNWGDVAAMQGRPDVARNKYNQCIELSAKLDFPEGVAKAQDGLRILAARKSRK